MVRFENALDVRPLENGCDWEVREDFYYDTDVWLTPSILRVRPNNLGVPWVELAAHTKGTNGWWRICIPRGFITDCASIPQVFWSVVGAPANGRYRKIAVVHDGLYRTPGLAKRPQADAVLLEGMMASGCSWLQRTVIYSAVRVGGFRSYKGGL